MRAAWLSVRRRRRRRDRRMWMALAALVAAGLIPLVWPGDVPFINDEPQLIASAVRANGEGRLAPVGLLGTYGFRYGPAPTWVYQALTPVTRDLVGIAALHILLMSAATAGGTLVAGPIAAAVDLVRPAATPVALLLVLRPRPLGQPVSPSARRARAGRLRGVISPPAHRPACVSRSRPCSAFHSCT